MSDVSTTYAQEMLAFSTCLQGFYVLIDHSSYLDKDPNMLSPALFAGNWGNLWRIITELPDYPISLRGRVFPGEPVVLGCSLS